jgi:hypothetical protein
MEPHLNLQLPLSEHMQTLQSNCHLKAFSTRLGRRGSREFPITKSAYLKIFQCAKLIWHVFNTPDLLPIRDTSQQFGFDQTHSLRNLAKQLFSPGLEIASESESFEDQAHSTLSMLSLQRPIFNGAFSAQGARCRVDILNPSGPNAWDIVEVKASTCWTDIHLQDLAFQAWVLNRSGLRINKVFLMHINSDYVRNGELDARGLFIITDVTNHIATLNVDVAAKVSCVEKIRNLSAPPEIKIGPYCDDPYECPLRKTCWGFLPEENVLGLYRGK